MARYSRYLRQRARPYLFSNSFMPAICAASFTAIDLPRTFARRVLFEIPFSISVVRQGQARIRTQVSAAHAEEDIAAVNEGFADAG